MRKSAILALLGARSIEVTGSVEVFNEGGCCKHLGPMLWKS
jgi:hypothetical protein